MENQYFTTLQNAGIRPSVQRIAIYEYLCTMKNHPTADTVHQALEKKYPALSRTTCYNTLKLFEEQKIVQSIQIEDEAVRYDADTSEHFHFKCLCCQNIFDIPLSENNSFNINVQQSLPDDFLAMKIQTNIWGICPSCKTITSSQNS